MGKKTASRLQKQKEYDSQWGLRLKKHKIDTPKAKGSKKKSLEEIKELVELPDYIEGWEIRDKNDWKATSYNIEKQKCSYISHLYVKYPTPVFLLDILISYDDYELKADTPLLIDWLLTIAQGGSFRKEAKNYFNKKEAHAYLMAPNDKNPTYNFWRSKIIVAGIPEDLTNLLIERVFYNQRIMTKDVYNKFSKDYILFFSKYHKNIDRDSFIQIVDYIITMKREGNFSMKGRTLSSIIRLSNEWHRVQLKLSKGRYVSWEGINIKNWKCTYSNRVWTIKQLKDSTALHKEGQKQRHCVGSYVRNCTNGNTSIFTMDSCQIINGVVVEFYEKNVTIEVRNDNRSISQVKGRMNRSMNLKEKNVLKVWAGKNGLTMSRYL